jgi:hypothetical protein
MNLPYDPYFTHCPTIAKCILNTKGPILELGTGVYSGVFIDFLAKGRKIISTDTDETWLNEVKKEFETDLHKFVKIECNNDPIEYNKQMDIFKNIYLDNYSIVFIDHGMISERQSDIVRFKDIAELIVVHDSSYTSNQGHDDITYKYNKHISSFKYTYEYTKMWPFTCVMSDINNLSWI